MINSKPYYCRHCKEPLGLENDKTLSIGLVKINHAVRMQCLHCGRQTRWRPITVNVKESMPTPVYAV